MTTHAMIDLETLDVLPTATVLTIGGVKFDPNSVKETLQPFYYRFDVDEQLNKGRTISESTMDWWATQVMVQEPQGFRFVLTPKEKSLYLPWLAKNRRGEATKLNYAIP